MNRTASIFLQFFLIGFTLFLLFSIFVIYPAATGQRRVAIVPNINFIQNAGASNSSGFPIENDKYKITYEQNSKTYYIFVKGNSIDTFVENKNQAQLALKNQLAAETLCGKNVIIASASGLNVLGEFTKVSNCD